MICKECGREMPETDKFCGICGTPNPLLENIGAPVQEYVPHAQPDSEPAQERWTNTQDNDAPVQEHQPQTQPDSVLVEEHQPYTQPDNEPVQENQPDSEISQEHRPNTQPVNEPYQEYPYPQTNGIPAQEYRPYTQTAAEPADMKMAGGKAKVKYTCSLTAVIVCVVVIFLLSVACGVFAGLYFSVRPAAAVPAHSITQYESSGES